MKEKIKDIRAALHNKTYYCALALALTLPDICCRVENGVSVSQNTNGIMYRNWVNTYLESEDFQFPIQGFETQTFEGEMCYSLRCKVLHNGNTDVKNIAHGVNVDELILTFPSDENYTHGYTYKKNASGKTTTYIGIDYVCERLCDAAEKFYSNWTNKSDFDKYSF